MPDGPLDLVCLYSFRQEDQESFKLKDSQNYASCLNVISNFQLFRFISTSSVGMSSGTFWLPLAITLPLNDSSIVMKYLVKQLDNWRIVLSNLTN